MNSNKVIPENLVVVVNLQIFIPNFVWYSSLSNSVGWENISTTILKSDINILAPILSNLINMSLETGIFPKSLKRAKILPIFKNKDKLVVTNYRPISILPVISKVYEKVFYNRL